MSQLELTPGTSQEYTTQFADVILPVPVPRPFTYRVPQEFNGMLAPGYRVVVPFGARKVFTGVIKTVHENPPDKYEAKYIIDVLDEAPTLNARQIKLFSWMAEYYLCTLGEVVNNGIPSGLKISSESFLQLNPEFSDKDLSISWEEELILLELQKNDSLPYDKVADVIGSSKVSKTIKSLILKQAIIIFENIRERYSPKIEKRLRIVPELLREETALEDVFKDLEKRPKQSEVLLAYLQEVPAHATPSANRNGLAKKDLLAKGVSESSLKTLVKNGVLEEFEIIKSRFEEEGATGYTPTLTDFQEQAKSACLDHFKENKPVLLEGVTGSGKTEIYIDLALNHLENGSQVLYLLPEIALTTQIVQRLKKVFGDRLGVYHSRYSDNERVEVWQGVASGRYEIVVGVRSAIYLPFDRLGLVIVDEEHEASYKQNDPAPRYHARDTALILAKIHQAQIILGSATPAIESRYLAEQGKYGLVHLTRRYGDSQLPQIELVDISREYKKKTMKGNFSPQLYEALEKTFEQNEQAIIFQNRRGYAPYLNCNMCGWVPTCDNCAVSLTYHQFLNELKCHYCGFRAAVPTSCEACGAHEMRAKSFGTEQLEEELKLFFPGKTIERMDLDTMKGKSSYEILIDRFASGEIDVIVGTQMIAKGLDFDKISLVGILDIDRMIHFPDFRAQERAFDICLQVAGRSGRRSKQGLVLIQTYSPDQYVLQRVAAHNYEQFYTEEIKERQEYHYPPFVRLIKITLKHRELNQVLEASMALSMLLQQKIGPSRVFGPAQPAISKIRNRYLQEIHLKLERTANIRQAKQEILDLVNSFKTAENYKGLILVLDVDPF